VDDSVEKIIEHWHGIKTAADAEAEAEKDKDGEGSDEESSDSDGEEGKKSKGELCRQNHSVARS
jgi:hypothetical protein